MIRRVFVGSILGGWVVVEFVGDGCDSGRDVCDGLICCPPFAVRQQEGRMKVGNRLRVCVAW